MLQFESKNPVKMCDGLSRRDFLRVGTLSAGAVGLSLAELLRLQDARAANRSNDINCILLFLVGGPSHLDTFDPKPAAPSNIRGPFRPIRTNVSGIDLCEHLPLMARIADQYAIVRSIHHQEAPIHETGQQMMQTGRLFRAGQEYPHYGSVVSYLRGERMEGLPSSVFLPGPIGNTGVSVSHGQTAAFLGPRHESLVVGCDLGPGRRQSPETFVDALDCTQRSLDNSAAADPATEKALDVVISRKAKQAFALGKEKSSLRERYGRNTFGQSCLLARRLIENGVRMTTVNMFDTVYDTLSWDCHADGGSLAVTLEDYKDTLCPMFDRAYTALLEDLKQRGLLDTTLVVAMGEFGRTPHLNPRGGRDHWPGCWSILFAGGGVKGGQVIGSSDKTGSEPRDRPVTPAEVAATVYRGMGIDLNTRLPGPDNTPLALVEATPINELFRG